MLKYEKSAFLEMKTTLKYVLEIENWFGSPVASRSEYKVLTFMSVTFPVKMTDDSTEYHCNPIEIRSG